MKYFINKWCVWYTYMYMHNCKSRNVVFPWKMYVFKWIYRHDDEFWNLTNFNLKTTFTFIMAVYFYSIIWYIKKWILWNFEVLSSLYFKLRDFRCTLILVKSYLPKWVIPLDDLIFYLVMVHIWFLEHKIIWLPVSYFYPFVQWIP